MKLNSSVQPKLKCWKINSCWITIKPRTPGREGKQIEKKTKFSLFCLRRHPICFDNCTLFLYYRDTSRRVECDSSITPKHKLLCAFPPPTTSSGNSARSLTHNTSRVIAALNIYIVILPLLLSERGDIACAVLFKLFLWGAREL